MSYQIIITDNGVYATRGGRLVFISQATSDPATGEVSYWGYMHIMQDHIAVLDWHIWSVDGRFNPAGEHEHDIISKV